MKKLNNKAFTLLEMLMVMFIIALLLLLTIPNITKHKESVNESACLAYADMAQTQAQAYELAEGEYPTSISQLLESGYITSDTCDDGTSLQMDENGEIFVEIKE